MISTIHAFLFHIHINQVFHVQFAQLKKVCINWVINRLIDWLIDFCTTYAICYQRKTFHSIHRGCISKSKLLFKPLVSATHTGFQNQTFAIFKDQSLLYAKNSCNSTILAFQMIALLHRLNFVSVKGILAYMY